ncbi:MAG TPA: DUF1292 domain-containing protein [Candidatus Excrementavichristensenella intestinipullorum]|nr:DUF1292 domain-containing protein [Candidatus Excrementavichristensenella intestinipullorum]
MEQEQDLVVIMDDEGNELTMEVLDYFFYEGREYAVMVEYNEEGCTCDHEDEACDCCEQQEAYIMRVVPVGDDQEEFVPVEEDLLEKLIDFVQNDLYEDEDDEDEDLEEDGEDGQ